MDSIAIRPRPPLRLRAPRALARLWPRPLWEGVRPSDVLFLVATYGNGHVQAARALAEAAHHAHPGLELFTLDFFELVNPVLNTAARMAYLYSVRRAPRLWREFYVRTERIAPDSFLQQRLYHLGRSAIRRVLQAARPRVVVSTHPTPGGVVAQLRREGLLPDSLAITVVTDFVLHSQWVHPSTDLYLVACDEVANELVERGIDPHRIRVSGIPIRRAFVQPIDREAARARLGAGPGQCLVVVLTGAFGMMRGAREACRRLANHPAPLRLVVVTGHDARLRETLSQELAEAPRPARVLGYVEDMRELMAAADVVVTKAGGLTVSEALAAGATMVVFAPIPGQEEGNAAYLERHGAARVARSLAELERHVGELATRPDLRLELARRARELGRPGSADEAWRSVAAAAGW